MNLNLLSIGSIIIFIIDRWVVLSNNSNVCLNGNYI